jgi:heme exporter protein A
MAADRVATSTQSPCAISATGLVKTLDDRPVLKGIDLAVAGGEYVVILGVNGAGKTTLLKLLATLSTPSSGELRLFGMTLPKNALAARGRLGLIGHQSMLYRDLTARENLELFAKLYGVRNPRQRATELLEIVGLSNRADDAVKVFSRGMTQRVSIARALVHEPDLLLADEPFAGLDVPGAAAVERLLEDLHRAGKTIVMVNHDVSQSLRLAERIVVLRDGRVALDKRANGMDAGEVLAEMSGFMEVDLADGKAIAVGLPLSPCSQGEGWGEGSLADRAAMQTQMQPSPYASPCVQGEGTRDAAAADRVGSALRTI